jgi:hypothetical protein
MKENILNGMNAMVKKALEDDLIRKNAKEISKAIATISQAEDVRNRLYSSQLLAWPRRSPSGKIALGAKRYKGGLGEEACTGKLDYASFTDLYSSPHAWIIFWTTLIELQPLTST